MKDLLVISPLYLILPTCKKQKKYHLNLNNYSGWHYHLKSDLKNFYHETILPQIEGKIFNKINIKFTYYAPDKRRRDKANALSVHEKYFCDSLVKAGVLIDDNNDFIGDCSYHFAGLDKDNPRVEIIVSEMVF